MRHVLVPRDLAPAIPLRARHADILSLGGETMGTTWSVKVVSAAHAAEQLRAGIAAVLDGVIDQMSTWIRQSDISRFNRAAPGSWIGLPEDFGTVLRCALRVAADSGGAYDPTIGALVGQNGSVTIVHNARYGVLTGKTVSLDPNTGFSFDAAAVPKIR